MWQDFGLSSFELICWFPVEKTGRCSLDISLLRHENRRNVPKPKKHRKQQNKSKLRRKLIKMPTDGIPVVSLFSGAMGLDLGLESAGFVTLVCVENDPEAVATIKMNRPLLPVLGDITQITGQQIRKAASIGNSEIPVLIGGPPCQAFSVFGNREGIEDARGRLLFEFVRLTDELRPHAFILENVRGLLSMPFTPKSDNGHILDERSSHGSLLRLLLRQFADIGYRVDCYIVNAVNYGAPQIRERLICVGNRHNLLSDFPAPRYSNRPEDGLPPFVTLGNVIGPASGFVDPCPEVMDFSPRKLRYLSMVPPGGNWRSLSIEVQKESMGKSWYLKGGRSAYWRKLSFGFPCPTVVTMPNHAGTSMCHPTELRAISVGEAAAIQEFPRRWKFSGNTTAKFRQIGNAVPTRLGRIAGEVVRGLLDRISRGEKELGTVPPHRIVHIRPHVRTRTFWKDGQFYAGDVSYYQDEAIDGQAIGQMTLWAAK
jgi:DNA (cytosine-5)-methyltransferase 1